MLVFRAACFRMMLLVAMAGGGGLLGDGVFPASPDVAGLNGYGLFGSQSVYAQGSGGAATTETVTSVPVVTGVTPEQVQQLKEELDAATDLSEEVRTQIATLIKQTEESLTRRRDVEAESAAMLAKREALSAEKANIESQLRDWDERPTDEPEEGTSLTRLETELAERQRLLGELRAKRDAFVTAMSSRSTRRETIRTLQQENERRLTTIATQLATPPPPEEPPLLTQALRLSLLAPQERLKLLPVLQANELALLDAEDSLGLPGLRREMLETEILRKEKEVKAWDTQTRLRRQDAVAKRLDQVEIDLDRTKTTMSPAQTLFEQNRSIVENEEFVVAERRTIDQKVTEIASQYETLHKSFESLQDRERKAKGSTSLGLRLRQQKEKLKDPLEMRHAVESRRNILENARIQLLDYEDQLANLVNLEQLVDDFLEELRAKKIDVKSGTAVEATQAFLQRKELLTESIKAHQAYTDSLDAVDREQILLAELTEEMIEWINERVLWIRSHQSVTPSQLAKDLPALSWLRRTDWITETYQVLKTDLWLRSELYLLAFLVVVVLRWGRQRQRLVIATNAEIARQKSNVDFHPTARVAINTLAMSIYRPVIMLFLGWRMREAVESTSFVRHLGDNLLMLGWIGAFFEFTRQVLRSGGLADAHLGWTERAIALLKRSLRQLILFGFPLSLGIALLSAHQSLAIGKDWERLTFAVALLFLALLLRRLTNPATGVLLDWCRSHAGSWVDRLQTPISFGIVSLPVLLAGLALYGYYYTATELAVRFLQTVVLIELSLLIRSLLVRSLTLKRRRLAIEQARERRQLVADAPRDSDSTPAFDVSKPFISLSNLNSQSLQLVNTLVAILGLAGCWYIWGDVLPALNQINTQRIWTTYETVSGTPTSTGSGSTSGNGSGQPLPIISTTADGELVSVVPHSVTLSDLLRAVVVAWLVFAATRNFPALLDMTLLQQLPIDHSVKYAITALTRYLIVLIGVLVVGNMLGLSWSSVQWLAAALTFGLAFGLQEIFANFVSGLIILFEQPVRVGDVVTIDGVTGIVSRIRMRSTTIADWDRKELVVPNKEFITNKLLNWTLTDSMTRLVILFEASYQSNPEQVMELATRLAIEHPKVMNDPPPVAFFESLGSSGLVFKLRAFVADVESRLPVQSDLNSAILRELRAAGIEIPFPQQDVHIRSLPPEWGSWAKDADPNDSSQKSLPETLSD
ncbi:MAG: mechanosensitive ion channel [Planctomycetaceae bacterium]